MIGRTSHPGEGLGDHQAVAVRRAHGDLAQAPGLVRRRKEDLAAACLDALMPRIRIPGGQIGKILMIAEILRMVADRSGTAMT